MNGRKISTTTEGFYSYGTLEEIVLLLKNSGFTAYDCSMVNGKGYNDLIASENYADRARASATKNTTRKYPGN